MKLSIVLGFVLGLVWGMFVIGYVDIFKRRYRHFYSSYQHHQPIINEVDKFDHNQRILCWIPMLTVTVEDRARILSTWGKRCNKFYFVVKEGNPEDDVIPHHYQPKDGFDLWNQIHRGWARIAERHLNDYDWFLKLDSDTYFSADNFRHLVHHNKWDANQYYTLGI